MDTRDFRQLTFGEHHELELRVRRDGIDSLTTQERDWYERGNEHAARMLAPVMPGLIKSARIIKQLSRFEKQAYRDLTPAQVMSLRRHCQVSQRRFRSTRPVARRRGSRARARSPGRLADDPPPEPELAAAPLRGAA